MNIKKDALSWINSLSGFQGGNPDSNLWFCGLEYQDVNLKKHIQELNEKCYDKNHFPSLTPIESKEAVEGEKFNKALKEFTEFYNNVEKIDSSNMFTEGGEVFKLNLFPLPQSSSGEYYDEDIYKATGIISKAELTALCMGKDGRFSKFQELLNSYKPESKVIICCSRKHRYNYILAFGGKEELNKHLKDERDEELQCFEFSSPSRQNKYCTLYELNNGAKLFVVPFLSGQASSPDSKELANLVIEIKKRV
ncbi:MAG: hypothetical protein GY829_05105 [Gammaproteobacteria bacterium]|nr:hypothetical protein [Gammaproteobacteria bacterium]